MKILGIDEAGRGCVIGDMVICGVLCDETKAEELERIGVKDSKLLSVLQREAYVPLIKNIIDDFRIIKIPPGVLDSGNLNTIERDVAGDLINIFKPDKVLLDTPVSSKSAKEYCEKILKSKNCYQTTIIGEPHADLKYPIVGAASILAKVERDAEIKKLHKKYGDFGSGYPADPRTYKFIREWNKCSEIVRRKWDTCKEILVERGSIMVLGENGVAEFCKFLINSGIEKKYNVGVLDLDIGGSYIGPPGSIAFGMVNKRLRKSSRITATIVHPVGALSATGIEEKVLSTVSAIFGKIPATDLLVVNTCSNVLREDAINIWFEVIEILSPDRIVFLENDGEFGRLVSLLPADKVYRFPIL